MVHTSLNGKWYLWLYLTHIYLPLVPLTLATDKSIPVITIILACVFFSVTLDPGQDMAITMAARVWFIVQASCVSTYLSPVDDRSPTVPSVDTSARDVFSLEPGMSLRLEVDAVVGGGGPNSVIIGPSDDPVMALVEWW